ncbi:STAS domain-containing protein [Acuticoccus kandeliae]|uniref:STAS domain-containing protein n=1 Tax=Acuticoccus kandeliae TaxID=2073160 RepID=UPI000D3E832B|nr:STAS domain-containing protein [Acuticoccus kandeliae]
MSDLTIVDEKVGDVLVVVPTGRIDSATAKTLETDMLGRLSAGETNLVVDLEGVNYISSAGLRVILLAGKKAKASGGAIRLCGLQPTILEVFEISGFLRLFEVTPGRPEAIAAASA